MSKHTPGPWILRRLADDAGNTYSTLYEAHISVGPCMVWCPDGNSEQEANARLIAAAPDLLAACERLSFAALRRESTMGDPCNLIAAIEELREAAQQAGDIIDKATCDQ